MSTPAISDDVMKDLDRQRAVLEARFAFWAEHYAALADAYPEQFIAVVGGRVVAADQDLYRLWAELDRLGIRQGEAAVEFMTQQPRFLLL